MLLFLNNNILFIKIVIINKAKLTSTTVAPVGVDALNDIVIPTIKHIIDIIADNITTPLKFLHIFIDINDGKIIKLDISNEPSKRIPRTTVKEHNIEKIIL